MKYMMNNMLRMSALNGASFEIDSRGTWATCGPRAEFIVTEVLFSITALRSTSNGTEEDEAAEAKCVIDMLEG